MGARPATGLQRPLHPIPLANETPFLGLSSCPPSRHGPQRPSLLFPTPMTYGWSTVGPPCPLTRPPGHPRWQGWPAFDWQLHEAVSSLLRPSVPGGPWWGPAALEKGGTKGQRKSKQSPAAPVRVEAGSAGWRPPRGPTSSRPASSSPVWGPCTPQTSTGQGGIEQDTCLHQVSRKWEHLGNSLGGPSLTCKKAPGVQAGCRKRLPRLPLLQPRGKPLGQLSPEPQTRPTSFPLLTQGRPGR